MDNSITEPKFKHRLVASFFVRFHMMLILGAVCLSGVITSKVLLSVGMTWMPGRYAIAVVVAYAIFFLMVRLWLWYVGISPRARQYVSQVRNRQTRTGSSGGIGSLDFGSSGVGGGSTWSGFGGGNSGGGGASDSWTEASAAGWLSSSEPAPAVGGGSFQLGNLGFSSPGKSGGGSGGGSFDLGDDGCLPIVVLVLLIALLVAIFGAGAYLIYQAPAIFAEAAFQAALASGLIKASKGIDNPDWKGSIFKATRLPFLIVLVLAVAFGVAAHRYCPAATKASEIFNLCKSKSDSRREIE